MKNLSLFLSGLVLTYVSTCLSENSNPGGEQCFSQKLNPLYPCCNDNPVVYTDDDGNWGVKDGQWCGIGGIIESCFSLTDGYPCCNGCEVLYTDRDGDWGVENGNWCGIKDSCGNNQSDISDIDFVFLKMENNKKNMLYSPLSIKYALKMLKEGASGNTYDEINAVIGDELLSKYKSIDGNLSFANGLFINETYYQYVKTDYITILENKYNAEIIEDDFSSAYKANKWIEERTLGIIKNMLNDNVVTKSAMIIINALAIDMEWTSKFNTNKTSGRSFYLENGEEMDATTMCKEETSTKNIAYYVDNNIKVIKLNLSKYSGKQLEFVAIMPKNSLSDYIKNISKDQIKHIDQNLIYASDERYGIEVRIPKFKFDYDLELKKDLKQLGIKQAFTKTANFTKIADPKNSELKLYVSDAFHKADIEFSEDGIKAAASTAFVMNPTKSLPVKTYPTSIVIDKPFMFIIRDIETKDIWFTGTVYKPNSWDDDMMSYVQRY